jgi:hypothetical protein
MIMTINLTLAVLNGSLALLIAAVYAKNYTQLRSPFTLALLLFAGFVVLHNAVLVYHYVTMMDAMGGEGLVLTEGLLQLGALSALAFATLR